MSDPGIDVSQFNDPAAIKAGHWAFVVVKVSDGNDDHNNARFDEEWADAEGGLRGGYHYARPLLSDGATQARLFAARLLAAGFKPDHDIWALDVEGAYNAGVGGAEWRDFVVAFMETARPLLGRIGFLYVGRFFYEAELLPLTQIYPWWLPDYGRNDGAEHPLPPGVNPVIHQYTSVNPSLDRDSIHDPAAWAALIGPAHPAQPKPATNEEPPRMLSVLGVPVHDADHYPVIYINPANPTELVALLCEPWAADPAKVRTAFGVSVFTLADKAVGISPRPDGVAVRYASGEVHLAGLAHGVSVA